MLATYRDNLTGIVHTVEVEDVPADPIDIPAPEPTLDERVDKVEAEVADTREVIEVLFGGAE